MIRSVVWVLLTLPMLFGASAMAQSSDQEKRVNELNRLKRLLPPNEFFEKWLASTGELPPEFDRLPSVPYPPDPLMTVKDGRPHRVTREEWPQRRKEISDLVEDWLLGHVPPPPGNVRAVIKEKRQVPAGGPPGQAGHEVWDVVLEFGPDHAAKLNCRLILPNGARPAPVYLVDNVNYSLWAVEAQKKGFAVCIYFASDPAYRHADDSLAYAELFGKCDWSAFRRRGWSASRAVDWLETLDFIDKTKIVIGGHSRSAKQAMACAAFDDRIAAILASSPGSGGSFAYRYYDGSYFGESTELLTGQFPDWVSLRVRFFAGRENKLPADCDLLYALFAPRPVLLSTAVNDWVESTWSVEQTYASALPVYKLLGAERNIGLRWRAGQHRPDPATSVAFSEYMLTAVGGGSVAEQFPFQPFHPWDYDAWAKANPPTLDAAKLPKRGIDDPTLSADGKKLSSVDWPARRAEVRKKIEWLLGDGTAYKPMPVDFAQGESAKVAQVLSRDFPAAPEKAKCRFGEGINGDIYYPSATAAGSGKKYPAVLWLPPFDTSGGYIGSYRSGDIAHVRIAHAGFITFAFDPIATGTRQEERRKFYPENPGWSLMGKMVLDARNAIDAIAQCPDVDPKRIYLVGYAMGGMVAELTAAMDDRVAGVVSIAGFTPFRTDSDDSGTGGVRRWSHLMGWMPRLGAFVGQEAKIPVDFNEVLAVIAPRPSLVIAPMTDWHAVHADVEKAVSEAKKAYALLGAPDKLALDSPDDWNRLTNTMLDRACAWLKAQGE